MNNAMKALVMRAEGAGGGEELQSNLYRRDMNGEANERCVSPLFNLGASCLLFFQFCSRKWVVLNIFLKQG